MTRESVVSALKILIEKCTCGHLFHATIRYLVSTVICNADDDSNNLFSREGSETLIACIGCFAMLL